MFWFGLIVFIEKGFLEVMEDLNFGGFLNVWVWCDKIVVLGDMMFVNIINSKVGNLFVLFGIFVGILVSGDVDIKEFMLIL